MGGSLKLRYGLEDVPPTFELLLLSLQWLLILLPIVLVAGKVVAILHFEDVTSQAMYIRRAFFITGFAILLQLLVGHRLPLVSGPSIVLIVGIAASRGSFEEIYTSVAVGGLLLILISASGAVSRLFFLFTPRVVAAVLLIVAFSIMPTVVSLISSLLDFYLFLALLFGMFAARRFLSGIWESTIAMWAMLLGSAIVFAIESPPLPRVELLGVPFQTFKPVLNPAIVMSFLVCYLALLINDISSMESVSFVGEVKERLRKGVAATGVANVVAGLIGVVGVVNYTLSPGVIAASRSASRYTLLPAGVALILFSFFPQLIALAAVIPPTVVAATLTYFMCSQLAAGIEMLKRSSFEDVVAISMPVLLSVVVSFMPYSLVGSLPPLLQPLIGNGFVIGVLAAILMEKISE